MHTSLLLDRRECAFFQYFCSSVRNPDELLCTRKANLQINLLQMRKSVFCWGRAGEPDPSWRT